MQNKHKTTTTQGAICNNTRGGPSKMNGRQGKE